MRIYYNGWVGIIYNYLYTLCRVLCRPITQIGFIIRDIYFCNLGCLYLKILELNATYIYPPPWYFFERL